MQKIGTVAFVQIQRYSMKQMMNDDLAYDTNPLQNVEKLWLSGQGIMGVADNTTIVDVHSINHPESKYRGNNKISFGFLPNYGAMRARFGAHLVDGIAGENILIDVESELPRDILGKTWLLEIADGRRIPFKSVVYALPCREFSIFCTQRPIAGTELKETLQFLNNGRRGYYAELAQDDLTCYVQSGDTLYIE